MRADAPFQLVQAQPGIPSSLPARLNTLPGVLARNDEDGGEIEMVNGCWANRTASEGTGMGWSCWISVEDRARLMHVYVEHKLLAENLSFVFLYSLGHHVHKSVVGRPGQTMRL